MTDLSLRLTLENKNFKDTKKITWLADCSSEKLIPVTALEYTSLITVPNVPKVGLLFLYLCCLCQSRNCHAQGEDLAQFVNYNSKFQTEFLGASSLSHLKLGDIIQLNRKGFFICDQVGF